MTLQQHSFSGFEAASGFDVSGAAQFLWEGGWAQKLGKRVNDTKARDAWWKGASKDWRQDQRVTYLAFTRHAPKGTRAQQSAWWARLGPKGRENLRKKYRGASFIDKAIDVVTLTPILSKIPIISDIHAATMKLHKAPFNALVSVANGERIDKAALKQFKDQLSAAKTLAPYAQTVVSFVPGIGTGLSAGLGAGLALAEGKPLDAALLAGVRGALPGGALAQAAFDVTTAVMAGKPPEQIAISVLPVSDGAKQALIKGAQVARAAAEGKRVDQAVLDAAISYLPPAAQKAAQVGVAVGAGALAQQGGKKSLEALVKTAASSAAQQYAPQLAKKIPVGAVQNALTKATKVVRNNPQLVKAAQLVQKNAFAIGKAKQAVQLAQKNQAAIAKASQAIQMFQGKKKPVRLPASTLRMPAAVRRVPAIKKGSVPNSDVLALRKQLNKLVAADKREDAQQAAELQRLREQLAAQQQMQQPQQPVYQPAPTYAPAPMYAPPMQQQYAYAMPQQQPFVLQPVYGQPGMFAPQAMPMALPPEAYQQQALTGLRGVLF